CVRKNRIGRVLLSRTSVSMKSAGSTWQQIGEAQGDVAVHRKFNLLTTTHLCNTYNSVMPVL
ncbi:hypothetical protein AMECASPLE_039373, partial [Ameca splendens]